MDAMKSRELTPGSRPLADTLIGRTLASDVLHRLREAIVACRLLPGERLRFEALRADFGVSFGTLREALAHLVREGLVIGEGQRGFHVAPMSRADLADLTDCWILIEREAIRLAAIRLDVQAAADLEECCVALEATPGDSPLWPARHSAFHVALIAGCGSPTLIEMRTILRDRARRYQHFAFRHKAEQLSAPQRHRALAEAVLAHESELAATLIDEHLREGLEVSLRHLDHPALPAVPVPAL